MLPDLLIIGAFKAGTTSLHHYLGQHAGIFMTRVKEPNFFAYDEKGAVNPADFPITDIESYERLFDDMKPGQLAGEASPGYLHSPVAPFRIHKATPSVKLIASLRNPVDRAYSHYVMQYRTGRTRLSVQEAFDVGGFWLDASLYANALTTYQRLFGEQLKVILYEDLVADADGIVNQLFEWLGLTQMTDLDTSERHNPGGLPRSKIIHSGLEFARNLPFVKKLTPPSFRARLAKIRNANLQRAPGLPAPEAARWRRHFHEDICRTQDILQIDLTHWLK